MEHGEIYMLHELTLISEPLHKCVRVSGIVQSVDIHSKQCYLFHKGHRLRIETALVDQAVLREHSLCQIIGDIRPSREQVADSSDPLRGMYVEASIARSVSGLDLDLFEQALLQRRKFLQDTGLSTKS